MRVVLLGRPLTARPPVFPVELEAAPLPEEDDDAPPEVWLGAAAPAGAGAELDPALGPALDPELGAGVLAGADEVGSTSVVVGGGVTRGVGVGVICTGGGTGAGGGLMATGGGAGAGGVVTVGVETVGAIVTVGGGGSGAGRDGVVTVTVGSGTWACPAGASARAAAKPARARIRASSLPIRDIRRRPPIEASATTTPARLREVRR